MGHVANGFLIFPGVFLDVADGFLGFASYILVIQQAHGGSDSKSDTSSDADRLSVFFGVALNDEPNYP